MIDFESDLFIAQAIREEPSLRLADFPKNEAWHYPALGPDVYFLFVRTPKGWQEGTTMDLLPPALRAGGISGPFASRAQLLGKSMRWIYKDLYVFSNDVRNRLVTLDAVVGGDGRAFRGNTGYQLATEVQRARQQDDEAVVERDEAIPNGKTRILEGRGGGTVWMAARFLNDDGSTSVLIPWRQPTETLSMLAAPINGVGPRTALLDVAVVSYSEEGAREGMDTDRVVVPIDGKALDSQLLTVRVQDSDGFLAIEWDQLPGDAEGRPLTKEPVRATVGRVDNLDASLRPGAAIGMSDLLLFDPVTIRAVGGRLDREEGLPAPLALESIRPGQEVAVYFEIYKADAAPLDVTTQVDLSGRTAGGLFRRPREVGAGLASSGEISDGRVVRTVVIGAIPTASEIRISVTATVDSTSEQVARSITLPVSTAP